jgi:glycosyltransferase involved in cell wall biosynthesis
VSSTSPSTPRLDAPHPDTAPFANREPADHPADPRDRPVPVDRAILAHHRAHGSWWIRAKNSVSHRLTQLLSRVVAKARQGPKAFAVSLVRHIAFRFRPACAKITRSISIKRSLRRISQGRWSGQPVHCPCVTGLVSVVLPVYNQADLLAGSIDSVLNQSYGNLELIIVNDGSRDGVEAVLAAYRGHPKVLVLNQANQKLPKALSNGFAFARGEFWTWTSADNYMHRDQLLRQVEFLRGHPECGLVYADYCVIDDAGDPLVEPSFRPHNRRQLASPEIHLPRDPRLVNVIHDNFIGPCFLYRCTVGRVIGEYDPNLGLEDFDYWMRVNHAFPIAHLGTDETLYRYRVHDNSVSARASELRIVERGFELMNYERKRQEFYRRPWKLVLDEAMTRRLAVAGSSSIKVLDFAPAASREPSAGHESDKVLYLIDSANLETLAAEGCPASERVVAWFDSIDDAYERWSGAARCGAIGITGQPEVAQRLDLLGVEAFAVGTRQAVLDLVRIHANNRAYYETTRPQTLRSRFLPQSFQPMTSQHVMVQVDHFDRGGMENMILGLTVGLRRRGLEVSLLVLGKLGPAAAHARKLGIPIWTLPEERRADAYGSLLEERHVGLINAHYSTYGSGIAARAGIPFVQVVHNSYVWLEECTIAEYRAADPNTTAYLCVSAQAARYSDSYLGLSVDKMIVVPNGIDTRRLEAARSRPTGPLRDELGIPRDDFVFLNVASIHGTKAHSALVQSFAHVVKSQPDSRLLIVGPAADPEYDVRLRRLIQRAGLGQHVILTGPREDVARFYWMADAFVMPSYWEGWSLALTEAVYTGLPVVATDVGAARELIGKRGGRLVKPPFRAITDLNRHSIGPLVHGEHSSFIAELAETLSQVAKSRRRVTVSDSEKQLLDQERMVDLHYTILSWLLQGGHPSAARAWVRTGPGSAPTLAPVPRASDVA